MEGMPIPPISVNRAPVLTLWASVVAERLGHPRDTALTLGRAVAGSSARAKAKRLGVAEERHDAQERAELAAQLKPRGEVVRLLGRDVPILRTPDGAVRANNEGKPASARAVAGYISRAFGDRLAEVRAAMEGLGETLPPEELNHVAFRHYEKFRPEVPDGVTGWGAKGELRIELIVALSATPR